MDGNADCPARVQNWLDMMSKHVRSLDPNHLITVGSEGFYGKSTPALQQYNPQTWAAGTGQDYVNNTNLPNIDFGTVHAWPDNWLIKDNETAGFLDRWIQSHISAGEEEQGFGWGVEIWEVNVGAQSAVRKQLPWSHAGRAGKCE